MASACDSCHLPGRCCSGLKLAGGTFPTPGTTALEALCELAGKWGYNPITDRLDAPFPFLPLRRAPDGHWSLWCPVLTRDGRCGDYEHRPYACMHYLPGTDALCVMHGMIEAPDYGAAGRDGED